MADSIEQKIIDEIVARMQLIVGTGDYLTSIGVRVEDSRTGWPQDELPAISVFEGTVTTPPELNDDELVEATRVMPVMIKCFLASEDTAAETAANARKAMADIFRAIKTDPLWKVAGRPLVISTRETAHGPEYVPDSYEISGVQVEIAITYYAGYFDMES